VATHTVGPLSELPPGSKKVVQAGAIEVGVFNVDGELFALPNVCPHQFGPLCKGVISGTVVANAETGFKPAWVHDGHILVCPWHGLEFDVTTGRCIARPKVKLRQYRVEVDADDVVKLLT
jgi:nitrite reductase/ring-hydroxylating ferredoxin subunit